MPKFIRLILCTIEIHQYDGVGSPYCIHCGACDHSTRKALHKPTGKFHYLSRRSKLSKDWQWVD